MLGIPGIKAIGVTAAIIASAISLGAGTASAQNGAYSPLDTEECTRMTHGNLCVEVKDGNKVHVAYTKRDGGPIRLRFGYNLRGGDYWDLGEFTMRAGDERAFDWENVSYPCQVVGFMQVVNEGRYQTPPASADSC